VQLPFSHDEHLNYGRRVDSRPSRSGPSVVVIDHDTIVRRAVVAALDEGGIDALADTALGREGVRLAAELAPSVVIVDPELPDMMGIDFVRSVHRVAPAVAILLLSSLDDDELAIRALREGANGYLSKRLSLEILPRIVRSMAAGEAVVTRKLTMRLVERLREVPETGAGLRPVRSALSSREWEVLDLICAGIGTRGIAADLELSVETVRSHVKRILRKLGAHSREEAAGMAAQMLAHRTVPIEEEPDELGHEARRFTRR
jgi:NarL family two-component system response regulator LiaR